MRTRFLPLLGALGVALLLVATPHLRAGARQAKPDEAQRIVAMADEVSKEVEALRGWKFKRPVKKELTTVQQTVEFLKRQVEKTLPAGRAETSQAFLRTIGLLPPANDLKGTWLSLLENQVGGFYDTSTRSMHLVARDGTPPVIERMLLAHELTHALDDQYVDLEAFVSKHEKDSEDMGLSAGSLVEGSATALMMQYMGRAMASGQLKITDLQQYSKQEAERSKPFLEAPRYFSAMLASYICGVQFLAKGAPLAAIVMAPDDRAIGEALMAAVKNPPRSSEQILHPEKYWDAVKADEPVVMNDAVADTWLARPGRWIVHADTVGEILTAILTSPRGSRTDLMQMQTLSAWTNKAAEGWGGDRFYLLASGDTRETARQSLKDLKGVWVTAWDTASDRDEFVAAVPEGSLAPGATLVTASDRVAIVYFGFSGQERAALAKTWPPSLVPAK